MILDPHGNQIPKIKIDQNEDEKGECFQFSK
jgi:hypothetical protein